MNATLDLAQFGRNEYTIVDDDFSPKEVAAHKDQRVSNFCSQ